MKVYIIVEAHYLSGCCSKLESEDLFANAEAHPTKEAARRALRRVMRYAVEAEYEGVDDAPDVDAVIDGILRKGYDGHDRWVWDATNRAVVWQIVESEVKE